MIAHAAGPMITAGRCPSLRRPVHALLLCGLIASAGCAALKQCAYEGFDRDSWQRPAQVLDVLKVEPGDHVADVGAGSGYFTFRLADAVGPRGKVYAVDVDADMTALLTDQARQQGYHNVEVILTEPDQPRLPEAAIDLLFTCNVYHHLQDRSAYFARAAKSLNRDGRVVIIDFNGDGWFAWVFGHWTPREVIEREMREAGYSLARAFDFLPKQVFLVFVRSSADAGHP